MDKIKIAIVGVGNCASSLVQGISFYSNNDCTDGLINPLIGGFKLSDIEIVAAFDVDSRKVGKDLSVSIFEGENNTLKFSNVPFTGLTVSPAPVLDGFGIKYSEKVTSIITDTEENVILTIKSSGTEVIVNYLPVGSKQATQFWATIALKTNCAFINCIPEFIASDKRFSNEFKKNCLPLLGDDVKSQFGATLLNRIIVRNLELRGFIMDKSYQLNFGGNMDFYNMLDNERLVSKKRSKLEAVRSLQKNPIAKGNIHISPSDFIEWLQDNKYCYINIIGRGFGGSPMKLESKLEVWDSPNSAGVVVDLIRIAKLALKNKIGGPLTEVCAFYMKSPPRTMDDEMALKLLNKWIKRNSK